MNRIIELINFVTPKAQLVMRGLPTTADEYETSVQWLDDRPQPSWDDLMAVQAEADRQHANREAESNRHLAFIAEADPLYFGWQRSENTEQAWRDKCDEIRARYPYQ